MQTLDVISVNIWQILISLCNLLLLFWLFKRFLFKPVKNVLAKRQAELDASYERANMANAEAEKNKRSWEEKLATAEDEAHTILQNATEHARRRSDQIIEDAEVRAEGMIRLAKQEAELERKKAEDGMKREIVEVSTALSEKLLAREINTKDHRSLIDSFIEDIGGDHD